MTLLLLEARCTDRTFAEHWRTRPGRERRPAEPKEPQLTPEPQLPVTGALFDHFAFLLYEYFATVPMGAARRVALAARAGGTARFLRYQQCRGRYAPERADRDCAWLHRYVTRQLRDDLPAGAPFWQSLAAAYSGLSDPTPATGTVPAHSTSEPFDVLPHTTTQAFAALARSPETAKLVTRSQSHLYAGLTLHQECVGWRQDFLRGHPSQVASRLLAELDAPAAATDAERAALVTDAARRFHYGGIAEHTLDTAAEQLCRALAVVTDLPPGAWVQQLGGLLGDVRRLSGDLDRLRRDGLARARGAARGSRPPAPRPREAAATAPRVAPGALTDSVAAAARYLRREQDPSGHWGDFLLLGQQSTSWVTGYVGWNLAATGTAPGSLPAAADWLVAHREPDSGWGYNGQWPVDVDSTANALLFLTRHAAPEPQRWTPALEWLLSAQRPDGGFATVVDPEPWLVRLRSDSDDLRGWTSAHPCVTAVAALLLAGLDGARARRGALRATHRLLEQQRPEGHWEAYWWASRLYTTCRAVQAIGEVGRDVDLPGAAPSRARAAAWLLHGQRPDGGWSGAPDRSAGAFDTALAVQALCELSATSPRGDTRALTAALACGTRWLLNQQRPDGSWPVVPILRVPRPQVTAPWEQTSWTESITGLDVVVEDWRQLFTTATALRALHAASLTSGAVPELPTGDL